jgi:hypothetical protein
MKSTWDESFSHVTVFGGRAEEAHPPWREPYLDVRAQLVHQIV